MGNCVEFKMCCFFFYSDLIFGEAFLQIMYFWSSWEKCEMAKKKIGPARFLLLEYLFVDEMNEWDKRKKKVVVSICRHSCILNSLACILPLLVYHHYLCRSKFSSSTLLVDSSMVPGKIFCLLRVDRWVYLVFFLRHFCSAHKNIWCSKFWGFWKPPVSIISPKNFFSVLMLVRLCTNVNLIQRETKGWRKPFASIIGKRLLSTENASERSAKERQTEQNQQEKMTEEKVKAHTNIEIDANFERQKTSGLLDKKGFPICTCSRALILFVTKTPFCLIFSQNHHRRAHSTRWRERSFTSIRTAEEW